MGCGNSVLNGNNDAISAKFIPFPFLHHPIDEINKRRRTNAMKEITPSKKELLLDGDANIDSFDHVPGGRKSVSEGLTDFTVRVDDHGAETDRRDGKVPENEEANEDEGMDLREDGITYPGSPSFRVYYLGDNNNDNHSDHNDGDDDDHDCHDDDRIGADKTQSNDFEASSAHKDTEESIMPKNGKRGRKIRNLKKAISIGKHTAAVKNIFSVRSCYMASSSSCHHDHPGHA